MLRAETVNELFEIMNNIPKVRNSRITSLIYIKLKPICDIFYNKMLQILLTHIIKPLIFASSFFHSIFRSKVNKSLQGES